MPVAVIYIAAVLLFAGVAPLPYGFYTLLRIVGTIVFAWAAFTAFERKSPSLPWAFGLVALVFNPLIPIHLPKEVWAFLDVGAGVLLLATKRHIQQHEPSGVS